MAADKSIIRAMYNDIFPGLRIGFPEKATDITAKFLSESDVIVIESFVEALGIIYAIRHHEHPIWSLRPVFCASGINIGKEVYIHTDGELNLNETSILRDKVNQINSKLNLISHEVLKISYEDQMALKVMRYLFTRSTRLRPLPSRHSGAGYIFPIAGLFFGPDQQFLVIKHLDEITEKGFLKETEHLDRTHLCRNCHSIYLNLREVCPKCKSVSLDSQDIIHHFKCAYVGAMSEFARGNELICPKCDTRLRHIGIDYDKPSLLFNCNSCSHSFQEPDMEGYCLDCGTHNELNELKLYDIYEYALTTKGDQASRNGFMPTEERNLFEHKNIVPLDLFPYLLAREASRSKSGHGIVALIRFHQNQIPAMNLKKSDQFKHEVAEIIASYVDLDDICSAKDHLNYFVLFPDSSMDQSSAKLSLISLNIKKLMADNFLVEGDILTITYKNLNENPDMESIWEGQKWRM